MTRRTSFLRVAIAAFCLSALAGVSLFGGTNDFYATFNPYFASAYHSRARIVENRPMFMTSTRIGWDSRNTDDFGKVGVWHWSVSSLTKKRHDTYHRLFNELTYGAFWTYKWDFARFDEDWKGWGLTTDFVKDWITLNGYRSGYRMAKTDATISEWRLTQSLDNPHLTPFYLLRRGGHPNDWFYARVGVKRGFRLTDSLTFTSTFHAENGNENLFVRRYGERLGGGRYRSGLMALNLIFDLAWAATDNLSFYTSVHQFALTDSELRDSCKEKTGANYRRELTIFHVGMRCRF